MARKTYEERYKTKKRKKYEYWLTPEQHDLVIKVLKNQYIDELITKSNHS